MVDISDLSFLEASIGISTIEIDPINNDANVNVLIIVKYSGYEGSKKFTLNINLEDREVERITLAMVKWSDKLDQVFSVEKDRMAKLMVEDYDSECTDCLCDECRESMRQDCSCQDNGEEVLCKECKNA